MQALNEAGADRSIVWDVPELDLVHGKEALVFAWLGLLRWLGMPNTLPSVTGASAPSLGGALWGPGPDVARV